MRNEEKVELVRREAAFEGYFKVGRYFVRHTLHRGGVGPTISREVFERGHAAAVLPYDPVRDEVVLIRQFRAGAYAAGWPAWIWEGVAGLIDKEGEDPAAVAIREAREEADLAIEELMPMGTFLTSPGGCSESCTAFCGRIDSRGAGGVFGLASEGEDILAQAFSFAEMKAMLERGAFSSAIVILMVQWLLLNREKVRAAWL